MKPIFILIICLMAACVGCAGKQAAPLQEQTSSGCEKCFSAEAWRVVHRIEADFGLAGSISLIGVSQGDPVSRKITSVLMTAEGCVLLEVEQSPEGQEVLRALPPFDKPEMVQGMMSDVALMFLQPKGKPSVNGTFCQWKLKDGDLLKVSRLADGSCRLDLMDDSGELTRTVRMNPPWRNGFAGLVELKAEGKIGYALGLHLLESERHANKVSMTEPSTATQIKQGN